MTSSDSGLGQQASGVPWWRDRDMGAAGAAWLLFLFAWQAERMGVGERLAASAFLLAILVGAYVFGRGALMDLIAHRRVGTDLLVLIAALTAVVAGNFKEAAVVAALYALTRALYQRVLHHAASGLRAFTDALPKTATVSRDGRTMDIPVTEITPKDIVVVAPGARLPTDGRAISSWPSIAPSPVLGVGARFKVRRGDVVLAGSVNFGPELTIRATRAASESALARAIAFLRGAIEGEGATQRALEWRYLAPLVLSGALVIAIFPPLSAGDAWASSFARASAFIVAAASWALAMSPRPPAVAALAATARFGVFVKDARILEQLATLHAVALTKSAVTEVESEITDIDIWAAHMDTPRVIACAADVAHASGSADLRPITSFARSMGIEPRLVHETRVLDGGATARTQAGWVYIARAETMEATGRLESQTREAIARLQAQDRSVFVIGSGSQVWGFVATRDRARADAAAFVDVLRAHGLERIVMLAADGRAAEDIASEVGIAETWHLSEQAAKLRELNRHGNVAVIRTDDANDAALAAAVRIRLRASELANCADADVLLLREDLTPVAQALCLACAGKRVVGQNLGLSLLTQAMLVVGVVLAQWTLVSVAVVNFIAAMAVLGNAYRFNRSVRRSVRQRR